MPSAIPRDSLRVSSNIQRVAAIAPRSQCRRQNMPSDCKEVLPVTSPASKIVTAPDAAAPRTAATSAAAAPPPEHEAKPAARGCDALHVDQRAECTAAHARKAKR